MAGEELSQRPFLYVEPKEDTEAKLNEAAAGQSKNFLFAPEFNAAIRAINTLHGFMSMTASTVLAVIGNDKLELGELGDLEDGLTFIDVINFSDPIVELGETGYKYITFTENNLLRVYQFMGAPAEFGVGQDPLTHGQLLQLYIQPEIEANTQRLFMATIDIIDTDDFSGFFCHDDQIKDITWSFPAPGRLRATSPSFADRRKVFPEYNAAMGTRQVGAFAYDGYVEFVGQNAGGSGGSNTYLSFQQGTLKITLFNNTAFQVENPE